MPDDELFQAAKAGGLDRPEQIAAQAERMLKDERAKVGMRDFHMQWLDIYGMDELEKGEIYKTFSPEVAKAMLAETVGLRRLHPDRQREAGGAADLEQVVRQRAAGHPLRRHRGDRAMPCRRPT